MLSAKDQFLIAIFECGILDLEYFFGLLGKLEENNVYLDVKEVLQSYSNFHLNTFIYEAHYMLVEGFLKKYAYQIETLLNIKDLERFREDNELYEIYTNLLDSHTWFLNDKIQYLFESSEFYYN